MWTAGQKKVEQFGNFYVWSRVLDFFTFSPPQSKKFHHVISSFRIAFSRKKISDTKIMKGDQEINCHAPVGLIGTVTRFPSRLRNKCCIIKGNPGPSF